MENTCSKEMPVTWLNRFPPNVFDPEPLLSLPDSSPFYCLPFPRNTGILLLRVAGCLLHLLPCICWSPNFTVCWGRGGLLFQDCSLTFHLNPARSCSRPPFPRSLPSWLQLKKNVPFLQTWMKHAYLPLAVTHITWHFNIFVCARLAPLHYILLRAGTTSFCIFRWHERWATLTLLSDRVPFSR